MERQSSQARPLNWNPHAMMIASACDHHVQDDRDSGWDHPVLWYLKDADGLDRVRLYDLDPSYLRHKEARRWLKEAELLYRATADLDDPATALHARRNQAILGCARQKTAGIKSACMDTRPIRWPVRKHRPSCFKPFYFQPATYFASWDEG